MPETSFSAVLAGTAPMLPVIVVIAVLCSVISAFYYLGVVVTMFMKEEEAAEGIALAGAPGAALGNPV